MSDPEALVRWYLVISLLAVGLLPFSCWISAGLGPLRGLTIRPLGIVALTALVWWPAAMLGLPFSTPVLVGMALLASAASWGIWWWRGRQPIPWAWLLVGEAVWLGAFLAYAWFRGFNPDIINTEKPMEIALLTSVSHSTAVPAADPWFAGYAINYYYFGYQTIASIVRLSGVPPSIAFNLALATIIASVAVVAMAGAGRLAILAGVRQRYAAAAAGLGAVLVLVSGNLETFRRLLEDPRGTIDASWWQGVGWQASRIIVDTNVFEAGDSRSTINEFPAFSFVLGDLHPHVLTLPLLATVLVLALSLIGSRAAESRARLLVIGGLVGLLYASNSWDAPTGLLLVGLALLLALRNQWRRWLMSCSYVVIAALIAALPFIMDYDPPLGVPNDAVPDWLTRLPILGTLLNTFGVVVWHPTGIGELLIVHGVWLAIFGAFAAVVIERERSVLTFVERRRIPLLGIGLLLLGVAVAWAPAVLVIGVPAALAGWLAWHSTDNGIRGVSGLFCIGFVLVLIPEFFFIQDVFGDRMNTVFKLYFQAWLILGIASASAIALTLAIAAHTRRFPLGIAFTAIVLATLPYLPLSADDWTNGFEERTSLNGEQYLASANPSDFAAIEWIREHTAPGDTIAEGPGCSYQVLNGVPLNRISAFTGVPTVVGWVGHESQWRRGQFDNIDVVLKARTATANALVGGERISATPEPRYIIIGRQETQGSLVCPIITDAPPDVAQRLADAGWVPVFEAQSTTIYARANDAGRAQRH